VLVLRVPRICAAAPAAAAAAVEEALSFAMSPAVWAGGFV
jgi:hypothetical protein